MKKQVNTSSYSLKAAANPDYQIMMDFTKHLWM